MHASVGDAVAEESVRHIPECGVRQVLERNGRRPIPVCGAGAQGRDTAQRGRNTEGAFATRAARSALSEIVAEARNTDLAKKEVLDILVRYGRLCWTGQT